MKRNGQNGIVENEKETTTNHRPPSDLSARFRRKCNTHLRRRLHVRGINKDFFAFFRCFRFFYSLLYYMIHVTISRARLQTIYSLAVDYTQPNTTIWCFLLFTTDNTLTHTHTLTHKSNWARRRTYVYTIICIKSVLLRTLRINYPDWRPSNFSQLNNLIGNNVDTLTHTHTRSLIHLCVLIFASERASCTSAQMGTATINVSLRPTLMF